MSDRELALKINFADAVVIGLKKYFVFRGTATRPEFWYFVLFTFLVGIVLTTIDSILWPAPEISENATLEELAAGFEQSFTPFSTVGQLALLIPSLSVTARRLHDAGFSGKWLLLFLVPIGYAIFAGFGIGALLVANEGQQVDLTIALFLILPIVAISFAVFVALVIMNVMPTRSFFNGNKYAEPKPSDAQDGAGANDR